MELKTYNDLQEHLLATMDSFTDQMCTANSGVSKEKFWNTCMECCIKEEDKNKRIADIMSKNVLREFHEYLRCDFNFDTPLSPDNLFDGMEF